MYDYLCVCVCVSELVGLFPAFILSFFVKIISDRIVTLQSVRCRCQLNDNKKTNANQKKHSLIQCVLLFVFLLIFFRCFPLWKFKIRLIYMYIVAALHSIPYRCKQIKFFKRMYFPFVKEFCLLCDYNFIEI